MSVVNETSGLGRLRAVAVQVDLLANPTVLRVVEVVDEDVLDVLEMTKRIGSTVPADLLKADLDDDGDIDDQDLTRLLNGISK